MKCHEAAWVLKILLVVLSFSIELKRRAKLYWAMYWYPVEFRSLDEVSLISIQFKIWNSPLQFFKTQVEDIP